MTGFNEKAAEAYFKEALALFYRTQWLYTVPVIEILSKGCLDQFPEGWIEALANLDNDELNEFVVEKSVKNTWPKSLQEFVESCGKVDIFPKAKEYTIPKLPVNFLRGLNPKKQHEVANLAEIVHENCKKQNIRVIVDAGCGLGYICQLLHQSFGYDVLGLEMCPGNVETAKKRQAKLYRDSENHVEYVQCDLNASSAKSIERILDEKFGNAAENVCLIGLHACGELSISMAQIFTEMISAKLFILVPCCYQKLSMVSENDYSSTAEGNESFRNFPMSKTLKKVAKTSGFEVGEFLKRPFLRLACQEPAERWRNMSAGSHEEHAQHVLSRAVLELYAHTSACRLKKRVRKATRISQCSTFAAYLEDALKRYTFEGENEMEKAHDDIREEIAALWEENVEKLKAAEIYTGLQLLLQAPAENLVLWDRVTWMRERGFPSELVSVMSRNLSPRCHVLISRK